MRSISFTTELHIGDKVERWITVCDVMAIGRCVSGPLRKRFNFALREAGRNNVQVRAGYRGQMTYEPYTSYYGELGGVNLQVMRQRGGYDRY